MTTVLIVEENLLIAEDLAEIVRACVPDCVILQAGDAQSAMQLVSGPSGAPALAVLHFEPRDPQATSLGQLLLSAGCSVLTVDGNGQNLVELFPPDRYRSIIQPWSTSTAEGAVRELIALRGEKGSGASCT